jgi:hypothetical protein
VYSRGQVRFEVSSAHRYTYLTIPLYFLYICRAIASLLAANSLPDTNRGTFVGPLQRTCTMVRNSSSVTVERDSRRDI